MSSKPPRVGKQGTTGEGQSGEAGIGKNSRVANCPKAPKTPEEKGDLRANTSKMG